MPYNYCWFISTIFGILQRTSIGRNLVQYKSRCIMVICRYGIPLIVGWDEEIGLKVEEDPR